jgi:hypothetical protein
MVVERDVTSINEKRAVARYNEYRVLCAALTYYITHAATGDNAVVAKQLLKKHRSRMDSTFRGAQRGGSKEKD